MLVTKKASSICIRALRASPFWWVGTPNGTVESSFHYCHEPRDMNYYKLPEGPFGTREALPFHCPGWGGKWRADKPDNESILAATNLDHSSDPS